MGKVSEHLRNLIEKQVKDCGIVVWYDAEGDYRRFIETLSIPGADIFRWKDSFFRLRQELDPLLEFVGEDGRPDPSCHVPPKVLVYVPQSGENTRDALVELEAAGAVMEPGATPWQRNTRLRVIADHVFRRIAPDQADKISKKVEERLLTLEELDRLSLEVEAVESGAVKLIFGTASLMDVALKFAASPGQDGVLEAKQALPELSDLFEKGYGFRGLPRSTAGELRRELHRLLLMGEVLCGGAHTAEAEKYPSLLLLPEESHQADRIRETCSTWRSRTDLRSAYLESALCVERDMRIADLELEPVTLSLLETFPVFEEKLIRHAEETLLHGNPGQALQLARDRMESFWSLQEPRFQLQWFFVEQGARVLILGKSIRDELKGFKGNPAEMVRRYTEDEEPWCLLDRTYRHLERHYSHLDAEITDDHALVERLMAELRRDYTETVELCAHRFTAALEKAEFQVSGFLSQDRIFPEKVAPRVSGSDKVAYMVVDALRYEMGLELVEGLKSEFDIVMVPGVAQLPTITSVGMAALLPGADEGMDLVETTGGKTAVALGESMLKDRPSRIKYLQSRIGRDVLALKLRELVKPSRKRQQEVAGASFILVTSQEIDQFGEGIEDESEARLVMDEVLDKLRKAVRHLKALGVQVVVVSADHGHLFGEAAEGGLLMDGPGGKTAELHRRVWIGQGGTRGDGFLRIATSQVHLGGPFELAFPRGLGCFRAKGGGGAYCHGGATLQELVIPVISMEPRKAPPYSLKTTAVKLVMDKPKITTRFFSVTATYHRVHGIGSSDEIRVKVAVRANRKEVGFVAMAAYGFEEGTGEILLRDGRPNAVTLMLTEDHGFDHVTVHVLDAVSQVELARSEPIPVDMAF